eukprot:g52684.t1
MQLARRGIVGKAASLGAARGFAARSFDPTKILPSGLHEVRIISNTVRDAQQSNLSAEMSDEHRQEIAALINDVYKDMEGPPGYEQTWGGTIPMFDIWKRGAHPFEELRRMSEKLPNVPQSALIRSNSLNAMGSLPKDVVDSFITCAARAGVNVFTNFCAHNDWRNHVAVAEAVHKNGQHYQAAISYAVHRDPTIYNCMWAVDLMRELAKLGAHSLYVKDPSDPSGVLTPEMAGVLAAQIKEAFPDIPLAMKNGANGVECSIGMADGAGQPYSLSMLRAAEEMGWKTGNPNKKAMQAIKDKCVPIYQMYKSGRIVRTPCIKVEQNGVAGGQRSILDKELRDAGQEHMIPKVDEEILAVRDQGGKVCQVTPVADSYAREAMRRLRGGPPDRNFAPGYAAILCGEGGLVKANVDVAQQRQALYEKSCKAAAAMKAKGTISDQTYQLLTMEKGGGLKELCAEMEANAAATKCRARISEVTSRIDQLERIKKKPALLASLEGKIARQKPVSANGTPFKNVAEGIKLLKEELGRLQEKLGTLRQVSDEKYEEILKQKASPEVYKQMLERCPALADQIKGSDPKVLKELAANSGLVTICYADMQPSAMKQAEEEVFKLDQEFVLGLTTEGQERLEENIVLQACYKTAAIPGLITNFFKNWLHNPAYWPPTYDVPKKPKGLKHPPKIIRLAIHNNLSNLIGRDLVNLLGESQADIDVQEKRLNRMEKVLVPEKKLSQATVDALKAKIDSLKKGHEKLEKKALDVVMEKIKEKPGCVMGQIAVPDQGKLVLKNPSTKEEQKSAVGVLKELVWLQAQS